MKFISTLVFLLLGSCLNATPSSEFWTICTTDVQAYKVLHVGEDNYFTVFNRRGHGTLFFPDVGLTYGLFKWQDVACEVGVDYLGSADDPLFFNAKIGIEENKLFCKAPSFSVGIFNVGTRTRSSGRTNQNIVDFVFGKTLPEKIGGRFFVGYFSGSRAMGKDRQGFMVAFDHTFCPAKDCHGTEYNKWELIIDYASGKNTIGGCGVGVTYFFTPDISILTGPVFFNDAQINGQWKWSIQLDINIPLFEESKENNNNNKSIEQTQPA